MGYSHAAWDKLLDDTFAEIRNLATVKGGEYSGDFDRLANFRRNGEAVGLPMETIWRVYAGKHWDAISQYVKDMTTGKERPRAEPIIGRVHDMLTYLILFLAILDEREPDPITKEMVEAYNKANAKLEPFTEIENAITSPLIKAVNHLAGLAERKDEDCRPASIKPYHGMTGTE